MQEEARARDRRRGDTMELPKALEELRERRVWVCYPLIWNEKKHGGVGGFDKPPVNPYTLYPGRTDDPESLATYDVAAAQIGKTAHVKVKGSDKLVECIIAGVGIALGGTGICGIDFDNVLKRRIANEVITKDLCERAELIFSMGKGYWIMKEVKEIIFELKTYTEVSPSGTGLHVFFIGKLPDGKKLAAAMKDIFGTELAEYQLFDSGYMTVTGEQIGGTLKDCTELVAQIYEKYFREVEPIYRLSTTRPITKQIRYNSVAQTGSPAAVSPSVVSSVCTYERWLEEVKRLSDAEILERIFMSGRTGEAVKRLYGGDTSDYKGDHSRADQALCTFLYGFTNDRALTERLFRSSGLYRSTGKSRTYLDRTLTTAAKDCKQYTGHVEFTAAEKRAYAKRKEKEEIKEIENRTGKRRFNTQTNKERAQNGRSKI